MNNDSFVDLFVGKGNVEAMPEYAAEDPSNLLIGQADGTFVEGAEAAGIVSYDRARGASLADFNLDGMVDLVVVNRREPVRLWRNAGLPDGSGAVDAIRSIGSPSSSRVPDRTRRPSGPGSRSGWATGSSQREVTVGGGHAGGQLGWIHFGVGAATEVEIRVQWPRRRDWAVAPGRTPTSSCSSSRMPTPSSHGSPRPRRRAP